MSTISSPATSTGTTTATLTEESDMLETTTDTRLDEPTPPTTGRLRATLRGTIRSEALKFRTARSNLYALGGAAFAAVFLGTIFASLAGTDEGPRRLGDDALTLSLSGFEMSQVIIAILGVLLVASEYQTGLIRTWFAATRGRLGILVAKVTVVFSVVFVSMLATAVIAFLAGQAVFPDASAALTLGDDGVLQAIVGTAFYSAVIAVIGVGLGFVLRSTAAGAGVVVTLLMIAPVLVNLLPESIADPLGKVLPSNAGTAVRGLESSAELLSAGGGLAVLLGWMVLATGSAAFVLRRRDA